MKQTYKLVILILFFIFTSCAISIIKHDYIWKEYPIASERISSQINFTEGQEISITKGKSNDSKIFLGSVGANQYYGSEQSLTDGIVKQFTKELQNRRLKIKDTAEKSLDITVTRSNFENGSWKIAATIEFTVKFGNGKIKSYTVRNSSPATVDRTYDGLVAMAVIELFNDTEVQTYINK
jgi:hypothetical protein